MENHYFVEKWNKPSVDETGTAKANSFLDDRDLSDRLQLWGCLRDPIANLICDM
jgi:hypothetical protein